MPDNEIAALFRARNAARLRGNGAMTESPGVTVSPELEQRLGIAPRGGPSTAGMGQAAPEAATISGQPSRTPGDASSGRGMGMGRPPAPAPAAPPGQGMMGADAGMRPPGSGKGMGMGAPRPISPSMPGQMGAGAPAMSRMGQQRGRGMRPSRTLGRMTQGY